MKINVAQQLKGHIGESRSYPVDEASDDGFPIEGEARFVLTNRSILVTGQFGTTVKCTCSRCLEEFEYSFDFRVEEEFFPAGDILIEGHAPADESAEGFAIGEDHVLDLSEAFRQNILLNLPQKPVCRPDCAGLCQRCGCNLNESSCDCYKERIDPRLAPLKELLTYQMLDNG
ncbi:MAG: DUF177 domain-containing protein [Dehalococcoidia bacterium]